MPGLYAKTWARNHQSPYQERDATHFPDWHELTIMDAFFNNLTSALMICACIAWGCGGPFYVFTLPIAMTVALALLLIDLGLLIADLGDPARFFHSLRVMRFTSPLSVGVWGLSCYGIFLGIATVCSWWLLGLDDPTTMLGYALATIMRLTAIMALIGAIVVLCYKGVVFSCSSQPGLCQARWLTPFMVSDSLLMAMGLFAILTLAAGPTGAAVPLILPIVALLIARCVTFGLLWQDVKTRARMIYTDGRNHFMGILVYGIAGVLPLILVFCGPVGIIISAILFFWAAYAERGWLIGLARPRREGDAA